MQFYFKFLTLLSILFSFNNAEALNKTVINNIFDQTIVDKIEDYFKTIKKIAVDVNQTDKSGKHYKGKLLISKPGHFRWNYYEPYPILIVGNESFVTIYDYEMQQATNIKPEENIFQFLISNASLDNDFDIINAYLHNNQYHLLIRHKDFDKRAHLIFAKDPVKLRSISIVDLDSTHINITFSHFVNVDSFDDGLFAIKNPEIFGEPARYNAKEIEKKYR